jgi:hypothetical protein
VIYLAVTFAVTLAIAFAAACILPRIRVRNTRKAQFKKGATTEADVVKALGLPHETMQGSLGERSISYRTDKASVVTFRFSPAGKLTGYARFNPISDRDRR